VSNKYRDTLLAELARVAEAVASYNAVAQSQGWEPVVGLDLEPGTIEAPADPVLEIREDGAALLLDYALYIEECVAGDDKWLQRWATERQPPTFGHPEGLPVATPYGMLPEIANRPGLTDRQRGNILQSCGLAAMLIGPRDTDMTDREYAARSFWGMDYSTGQRVAIMDCHAFMEAKPQSGFSGAKLADVRFYAQQHAQAWIRDAKKVKG
jgi:hypothetical protein